MTNTAQVINALDEQSAAFLQADQHWNMNLIHQLPSAIVTEPAPDPDEGASESDDSGEA